MRNFLILVTALLTGGTSFAQVSGDKDLFAMVEAERAFAKLAIDKNTREAFLTYLTDKTITFRHGPVVGLKSWEESKADDSQLIWEPVIADMAASGDFGYTAGPSQWRIHRDSMPGYYGDFISIWKKDNSGTWKNMLDIGVGHQKPVEVVSFNLAPARFVKLDKRVGVDFGGELIQAEQMFILNAEKFGWPVCKKWFSETARLYRSNNLPVILPSAVDRALQETGLTIVFKPIGWSAAHFGDLGYVYGTAVIERAVDGKPVSQQANYVRIWKKEGKRWKVVVDVLANWNNI